MMKEKDFDHIVKQKLEAINEAPPAYMWDRIATGMATQGATNTSTGLSTGAKLLYVAAAVVFIVGIAALFLNPEKATKRSATRHFSQPQHKLQTVNNGNEKVESTKGIMPHSDINNGLNQELKNNSADPLNAELIKTPETAPRKSQPKVASIDNEVFPELPSSNEIRNTSIATSTSISSPKKEDLVNAPVKSNTSLNIAVVEIPNQVEEPIKKQPEVEEKAVVVSNQNITESANQASENNQSPSTESIQKAQQKADTSSAVKEVMVVTGGLPDDIDREPSEAQVTDKGQNPKARILSKYSLGLHYGPEFMDVDGEKFTDQAVDLSFNYQNMNFIVQTGLGVRFSEDHINYDMDYKRWEYWKTQYRFDGMDLVINSSGDTIPVPVNPYYEDLYDSLNHSYHATATEQYTSLQIPILVGYQKDYKNFAVFVKGGIRYSLIVYQNTKNLFAPDENSQITNFNYPEKSRAKSNIDYELSIGGAYKVNKQFQLHVEVFGRYYHYSIYEENPPSGIHPWSASIRVGLIYVL